MDPLQISWDLRNFFSPLSLSFYQVTHNKPGRPELPHSQQLGFHFRSTKTSVGEPSASCVAPWCRVETVPVVGWCSPAGAGLSKLHVLLCGAKAPFLGVSSQDGGLEGRAQAADSRAKELHSPPSAVQLHRQPRDRRHSPPRTPEFQMASFLWPCWSSLQGL